MAVAHIGADFWSVEMKLPFSTLALNGAKSGDLWHLGVGHGRIANSSGGSWVPNHGISSSRSVGLVEFE
jgi:hypothetical protein